MKLGSVQWLDDRSPAQVVDDVQAFARRRPGAFLALAVGAGLAAGRLTRGLKSAQGDDGGPAASTPRDEGQPGSADAWSASLAEPIPGSGYQAPQIPAAPDAAGTWADQGPAQADELGTLGRHGVGGSQ